MTNDAFQYRRRPININYFHFNVTDTLDDVILRWLRAIENNPTDSDPYRTMIQSLDWPSGCEPWIVLPSYYDAKHKSVTKWRRLFVGRLATCREVIQRILTFYKHKTIRRCMRGHNFFFGFEYYTPIDGVDSHGPLHADCVSFLEIDEGL
jgi:hypothetical protein